MLIQLTPAQRDAVLAMAAGAAAGNEALSTAIDALRNPFTPRIFIGVQGGIVQGATTNCEMDMQVADHDTEGASDDELVYLSPWEAEVCLGGAGYLVDAQACDALFADALRDGRAAEATTNGE